MLFSLSLFLVDLLRASTLSVCWILWDHIVHTQSIEQSREEEQRTLYNTNNIAAADNKSKRQ
jgi:hypothetical protein